MMEEVTLKTEEQIESPKDWKKQFTTVTPFSKALAVVLFLAFPCLGFYLGYLFGTEMNKYGIPVTTQSAFDTTHVVEQAVEPESDVVSMATYVNEEYGFSLTYPASWIEEDKDFNYREIANGDLVFAVNFYDPKDDERMKLYLCDNNSGVEWRNPEPSREECEPILSKASMKELEDARSDWIQPTNIFVRVFKTGRPLRDWLISTYDMFGTELQGYRPGRPIELDGIEGLLSSTGCCAGIDGAYAVKRGDYVYEVGSNSDKPILDDMAQYFKFIGEPISFGLSTPTIDGLEVSCHENENYYIVVKENGDRVGEDILVKPKKLQSSQPTCTYVVEEGDYELASLRDGEEIAQYYKGLGGSGRLDGDSLILDVGTGPEPRILQIYDLSERKLTYTDEYWGLNHLSDDGVTYTHLSYYRPTQEQVTVQNCDSYAAYIEMGLNPFIAINVEFDLTTMIAKTDDLDKRCFAGQ